MRILFASIWIGLITTYVLHSVPIHVILFTLAIVGLYLATMSVYGGNNYEV